MTTFERGDSDGARITANWDGGFSWIAHPEEDGQRGSHAVETEAGTWLVDPLDAPDIEERIASLAAVTGVAVLSCYHTRDAGRFARRHDVAVHIPAWMDRVDARLDAPVERYTFSPAPSVRVLPCRPFPGWQEAVWYHEPTGTLVVPDSLGTADLFRVGDERLGLELLRRLLPPTELAALDPERILVGHGEPVTGDPGAALRDALDGARRSFPEALVENGPESVRTIVSALRD